MPYLTATKPNAEMVLAHPTATFDNANLCRVGIACPTSGQKAGSSKPEAGSWKPELGPSLLASQCHDGVHTNGAAGGEPAGDERDRA